MYLKWNLDVNTFQNPRWHSSTLMIHSKLFKVACKALHEWPAPVCHLVSWHSSQSSLSAYHTNTLLSFSPIQGLWMCYPFPWNILQLLIPQVPPLSLNAISSNTLTILAKESHAIGCIMFYNNTSLNFCLSGPYRKIIRQ